MPLGVAFILLATVIPVATLAADEPEKTTLTWGMMEPIDSLNPFIGVNDNAYIFYGLVYDYLVAVDEDMKPHPNLALNWSIVPDQLPYGSVWQYNLTHNARWHDNEPFTADDVVFTINYQIGSNYTTMWAYQPYTILIKSVEKINDYTVRIHFKDLAGQPAPCPFGDKIMMPIVPQHIWKKFTPSQAAFEEKNSLPIGTGPFMCTENTADEFVVGSSLLLKKNADYHGIADFGQQIRYDELVLKFYLESAAMLTDMKNGVIDTALFSASLFKNLMDYLASNPNAPIGTAVGYPCTGFNIDLEVNMDPGGNTLRHDLAVRQAMAYATDKAFIRDNIYKGYAKIGASIISPIYGDYYWEPSATEIYDYDLAKANATLDAAGYTTWKNGIRYANSTNPYGPGTPLKFNITVEQELIDDRDTATFLTSEWKKIGIELNTNIVSTSQWNNYIYNYNYDLTISYWSGDPDPNYLFFIQTSYAYGGWSENAYDNPAYDANYTKVVETLDEAGRLPYAHNLSRMMYHDCAFMVTVYPLGCYAYRTDHFSGWGNMTEHPGRSLSNYWTANPLFFDLVPLAHKGSDITPILIGLGVVVAAIIAVALFMRFRRGKKEEEVRLP